MTFNGNGNLTGSAQYFNDRVFYNGATSTSMRFRRGVGSNTEINRDPSSAGDRKKHTLSFWVKRCKPSDGSQIVLCAFATSYSDFAYFRSDDRFEYSLGNAYQVCTDMEFRDVSAWYHIVAHFDVANSTTTSRLRFWVNGVEQTKTVTYGSYPADQDYAFSNTVDQTVGGATHFGGYELDGYLCDLNFIDGSLVPYTSFGEFKNGIWIPIDIDTSAITYGTNGFRMLFNGTDTDGASTSGTVNANSVGASSVNSNHFHAYSTALANHSALPDNPENNFCTYNPLDPKGNDNTFSEGNLKVVVNAQNTDEQTTATFAVSSGKWYWEHRLISTTTTAGYFKIGLRGTDADGSAWTVRGTDGETQDSSGTTASSSVSYTTNNVIGIYLDMDNSKWYVSVDGVLQNSANLTNGTGFIHNNLTGELRPFILNASSGGTHTVVGNFGQDGSFAGTLTGDDIGDATDGNGNGLFKYAPPSGYLALCSANLPEPTISSNALTQADDHFNTLLYNGDGQTTQDVTGVGFAPDWTWIKERSSSSGHVLADSSRGYDKYLTANEAIDEGTGVLNSRITSGTGGFQTTNSGATNQSSQTYVAWNWKANNNVTSTIAVDSVSSGVPSIASTVQANTDAGFSIVTYTGTGTAGTIGHGLGKKPSHIIVKARSHDGTSWTNYHGTLGAGKYLALQSNQAVNAGTNTDRWNNTEPTDSVFSVGTHVAVNNSSSYTYVAYCFAEVLDYSKIGSYTGNGDDDGTFVYTGFRPAWVMVKRTDSANNWVINDSTRTPSNEITGSSSTLYADTTNQESDLSTNVDFLSNGFKARTTGGHRNASGTYIYMAFAEAPFKYANAR